MDQRAMAARQFAKNQVKKVTDYFKPTEKVRTRDFIREVPGAVGQMFSGTRDFVGNSGKIMGEGLAYATSKNVRDQYKAGNTNILPTISNPTAGRQLLGNAAKAFGEVATAGKIPGLSKLAMSAKLAPRMAAGGAMGYGYGVADEMSKPEAISEKTFAGPNPILSLLGGALFGGMSRPASEMIGAESKNYIHDIKTAPLSKRTYTVPARTEQISLNRVDRTPFTGIFDKGKKVGNFNMGREIGPNFIPESKIVEPFEPKSYLARVLMGKQSPVGMSIKAVDDPLLQEARKYKSAEEFVKSKVNMYHGTPYEFDKFDSSKIMTGEAENAMGRGLYMTDSPNVADYYKRTVTKKPVVALKNVDGTDVDARTLGQITFLKENKLAELPKEQQVALIKQQINAMEDLVRQRNASPDSEIGKLLASYKKIDPDSISVSKYNNRVVKAYGDNSSFIDTKAPLSNEQVTKLKKALGDNYLDWNNIKDGQDLYFKLARKRKNPEKVLSDAGIKGMKYPVGELSAKQYGGSNYVFFDDKNLLTEKQLTDLYNQATKK